MLRRNMHQEPTLRPGGMDQNNSSYGICLFSLTLHGDLEGGAVTLVFGRHLTPVAASVTSDHFDDLHLISVDLRGGGLS